MVNQLIEFLQTEIKPYLASQDKKPWRQQWRELRALWARYHCIPYHYLKHRMYERSARPDCIDFMPAKLMQHFRHDRNPRSHVSMLNNKLETVRALVGSGVRCVETLVSISAEGAVTRGDGAAIAPEAAAEAIRAHGGTMFVKPINSRAGYGAYSVGAAEIDAASIKSLRNVVIQPVLRNHPIIAALNDTALNTARISTFLDNGSFTLIGAMIRIAHGNAVVDNCSQGAFAIGVDVKSGRLNQTGMTMGKFGRQVSAVHPDSQIRFGSITLPYWREVLELAERAAFGLQPHAIVGHDIAITADGPVFIEANAAGDFFFLQDICGPMANTGLGKSVLAHWLKR